MLSTLREFSQHTQARAEILADELGPWGIEVIGPHHERTIAEMEPRRVAFRADRLCADRDAEAPALFQFLPANAPPWAKYTSEAGLADRLHRALLVERGIGTQHGRREWREIRQAWHGSRRYAIRVVNSLLRIVHEFAIEPAHLRTIRRYPIRVRGALYRGLCLDGPRAWQLAETFPVLAVILFGRSYNLTPEAVARLPEARAMVRAGARLAEVAAHAGLPMQMRRIRAQCSGLASNFLDRNPELLAHHMPDTVPKQRAWLRAVDRAARDGALAEFGRYVGRHFDELGHFRDVPHLVASVRDWVDAGERARTMRALGDEQVRSLVDALRTGDRAESELGYRLATWWKDRNDALIDRPFDSAMAPATVLRLSDEWHERVATLKAGDWTFPAPWYSGGTAGELTVEPLTTPAELTRAAHRLHNCGATYAGDIASGNRYLYVVRKGDALVAMLELGRRQDDLPELVQLAGACNAKVPKPIESAVRKWLRERIRAEGRIKRLAKVAEPWQPIEAAGPCEICRERAATTAAFFDIDDPNDPDTAAVERRVCAICERETRCDDDTPF